MEIKNVKWEKLGKLVLFFVFRYKTIETILFFLVTHLLGSLTQYLSQDKFVDIIRGIGALLGLRGDLLVSIAKFVFGVDLVFVLIESFLLAIFIWILIFKIKKESRLKEDSKDIKSIKEMSSETNQDVKYVKLQLAEFSKKLDRGDDKTKINISYLESSLTTIIKYCSSIVRNGRPNQALDTLSQHKELLKVLDKKSSVVLEFNIAEAKALRATGKEEAAIAKNEEIISLYKDDIRPYLYLADMYLQVSDFENYNQYFEKAKKINETHPVLRNLSVIYDLKQGKKITLDDDDTWGEDGSIERASCYYFHSVANNISEDKNKRDEFLGKAISTDKDYFPYKIQKGVYKIYDLDQKRKNGENISEGLDELKKDVEKLEFTIKDDDILNRLLELESLKLDISFLQHPNNDHEKIKKLINGLVDLFVQTRFNDFNDHQIKTMLDGGQPFITEDIVNKLVDYIVYSKKEPSDLLVFLLLTTAMHSFDNIDDVVSLAKRLKNEELDNLLNAFKSWDEDNIIKEISKFDQVKKFKIIISIKNISLRIKMIDKFADSLDEYYKGLLLRVKTGMLYESNELNEVIKLIDNIDLNKADAVTSELAFDAAKKLGVYPHIERDALKRLLELNSYPDREYEFLGNLAIVQYHLKEFPEALRNAKIALENGKNLYITGLQFLLFIVLDILISDGEFNEAETIAYKYDYIEKDYKLHMKLSEVLLLKKEYTKAVDMVVRGTLEVKNIPPEQLMASSHQLTIIQNASGEEIVKLEKVDKNTFVKLSGIEDWFFMGDESSSLDAVALQDNDVRYKTLIDKKVGDSVDWVGDDGRINKIKRKIEDIRSVVDYIGLRGTQSMGKLAQAGSPFIKMVEVGKSLEDIKDSLMKFLGKEEEFFEQFKENKLPFSFYVSLIGSVGNAFSKIRFSQGGFIPTVLNTEDWEYQRRNAEIAINGRKTHIDGTSLLMLVETDTYKKIIPNIPNFVVPGSAIDEHRNIIKKFTSIPKNGSLQVGLQNNDVKATLYDEDSSNKIRDHVKEFCGYIQDKAESVYGVADKERVDNVIEERIIPPISDATIKAQQESDSMIMTEDPTYISLNSQFTQKRKPDYFSLVALASVLLEQGKICLDDYLTIFYWSTVYRERFLATNTNFIFDAVVNKYKGIVTIQPDFIDKFNLELVWSDDYDANINSVINVCSDLFTMLIKDVSITNDYLEIIFPKLYIPVLKSRRSHDWADKLLQITAIKIHRSSPIYSLDIEDRFALLQNMLNNYLSDKLVIR